MDKEPITEFDLLAYVDGRIDGARRVQIERHLAENPELAARIMADLSVNDTLRLRAAEPIDDPAERTLELARRLEWSLRRRRALTGLKRAASVAAVLCLGWWLGNLIEPEARASQVLVSEAMEARKASLLREEMVSQSEIPRYDRAELASAMKISLPVLPAEWTVVDVQVFPSDIGPGVLLVARYGGDRRVSLFAVNAPQMAQSKPAFTRQDDRPVAYWQEGTQAYVLTGAAPALEIRDFALRFAAERPG